MTRYIVNQTCPMQFIVTYTLSAIHCHVFSSCKSFSGSTCWKSSGSELSDSWGWAGMFWSVSIDSSPFSSSSSSSSSLNTLVEVTFISWVDSLVEEVEFADLSSSSPSMDSVELSSDSSSSSIPVQNFLHDCTLSYNYTFRVRKTNSRNTSSIRVNITNTQTHIKVHLIAMVYEEKYSQCF